MDQQIKPRVPQVSDTVRIRPTSKYLQEFGTQLGKVEKFHPDVPFGYEVRMETQSPQEDTWPFDLTELEMVEEPEAIEVFL